VDGGQDVEGSPEEDECAEDDGDRAQRLARSILRLRCLMMRRDCSVEERSVKINDEDDVILLRDGGISEFHHHLRHIGFVVIPSPWHSHRGMRIE